MIDYILILWLVETIDRLTPFLYTNVPSLYLRNHKITHEIYFHVNQSALLKSYHIGSSRH